MVDGIQRVGAPSQLPAWQPAAQPAGGAAVAAPGAAGPGGAAAPGDAAAIAGGNRVSALAPAAAAAQGGSDADFVRGLYRSILGREADAKGFEHHMKLLAAGMSREQMAAAIGASQERRNRDAQPDETFVRNLHRELWNKEPSEDEVKAGVDKLKGGLTRDDLIRQFLASPNYVPSDTNESKLKPDAPGARPGGPAGPAGPGGPAQAGPGVVRDGPGGFLWKPISDSTGKLAVLLPPQYAGQATNATLVGPDGKVLETGQDGGVGNGDRQHYRFNKPGGKYPPGTTVVVELAGGGTATWTVQNTGARND